MNKNKNESTYMFKNKKGEVMFFCPLFKLMKLIENSKLDFASHYISANTCKLQETLNDKIKDNDYLTQFLPNVLGLNIESIRNTLAQRAIIGQRDGWNRSNGQNLKLAAELFNTDHKTQNLSVDISCAGKDDNDMIGVVFDDFLSKYFDKAQKAPRKPYAECKPWDYSWNGYSKEILYYRNFNITDTSKLVTGLSNFNTQVFRHELLKRNMFLGNDMNIYTIGQINGPGQEFQFSSNRVWTSQITRCFKIITENVWVDERNIEHNLYDEQEASRYHAAAMNHLLACFAQMGHVLYYNPVYNETGELVDDFKLKYDLVNKRFVMEYRNGVKRDATAWLYDQLCDAVTKNQTIASTRKSLKTFLEELSQGYSQSLGELNQVSIYSSLYRGIMIPTRDNHNEEKLDLVNNIVDYFTKDLINDKSLEFQLTNEEKENMEKCFFTETPIEFFFKNSVTLDSVINRDKVNLENGSGSEKNVIEHILQNDINNILTPGGVEFLQIIKTELLKDKRITNDDFFDSYKLSNEYIYRNNSHRKTKIEFSILKALIECINDGPRAWDNFRAHLSNYLNYFFCNKDNIGKKELKEQIDKERSDINRALDLNQSKRDERNKQTQGELTDEQLVTINKKYGTNSQLFMERQTLEQRMNNLKKNYFFGDELAKSPETDNNSQYNNPEQFMKHFLGYDENIFEPIKKRISNFVGKYNLLEDKCLQGINDRKEKISKKTDMLIEAIKDRISYSKSRVTIDWFELCIKYVLMKEKIDNQKVSDGIFLQQDIEKSPDEMLNFWILELFINFAEAKNEFNSNSLSWKQSQAYGDNRVMRWFDFLQNFINAGYFLTNDCTPDEMCEYIYRVRDIEFLMNHNPSELSKLLASEGDKPADALINFLFKNISFGNEEKKKEVIKTFKMMVFKFSYALQDVKHMTQFNMMKFARKDRKFTNGVLYETDMMSDFVMVPIQEAYNKAKNIDPTLFNRNIKDILPKLPEGMKWAEIDQESDLYLNTQEWKMLSVDEVEKMFADDAILANGAKFSDYCFKLLAKRKPREFDEFLMSANTDYGNTDNSFEKIYQYRKLLANSSNVNNVIIDPYDAFLNSHSLRSICAMEKIIKEDNKKIGWRLVDDYISALNLDLQKLNQNNQNVYDPRIQTYNLQRIFFKPGREMRLGGPRPEGNYYDIIGIITSLIGNVYCKWNNVADESERIYCENTLNSVLGILEIALKVLEPAEIFDNNKDLILWLYLMYKRSRCNNEYLQQNKKLPLDDGKYFLKNYKIGDGAEKIFKKNVFYMNDDRSKFIDNIIDKGYRTLAEYIIIDGNSLYIPWKDQVLTLEKYEDLSRNSNEYKKKVKVFFNKQMEKNNRVKDARKAIDEEMCATRKDIVAMLKSSNEPEQILKTLNKSEKPEVLFWAFKILYNGKLANKSQDDCNKELQKLLLSNESENIIKRLFRDSDRSNNLSFNKTYNDQINMSIDSIKILSDLVLNKNMKISLTTAIDLVDTVNKLVVCFSDEEINRQPFDFNQKYKDYFRGGNNIFDFVVKIIGQIPISSISGTSDAEAKLKRLPKLLDGIFESEVIGRGVKAEDMCQKHKSLRLWMYLLYKRLIYNKDQNNDHSEDILLKDCKIEATPAEMKKQGIVLDSDCMDKFEKLINPYNSKKYSKFVDIRRYLCGDALVDLVNDKQDWRAFDELFVQFPDKTGNLLLSDEKDGVISKLFLSSDELFKPIEPTKVRAYGREHKVFMPEQQQAGIQKHALWAKRFSDIYNNIIKGKEKLSFRVVLSYIKFVHNISRWLREFNLVCKGKVLADLVPGPLDAILDAIGKISFKEGNIQDVATKEEYDELLKTIQDEVNYYNTDNRNIAADKKSDLLWYLSLLNEKINNGNDCSIRNDNIIEFKKSDGDYSIRDYKLSKILNENETGKITQEPKVLNTVIARLKDKKFLPVEDESALSSWKKDCILDLEKTKLDKMTGILNNAFEKQCTTEGKKLLEQIKNRAKIIQASEKLKNRILTTDRKKLERAFKSWKEKTNMLKNKDKKLEQFNDVLAQKRKNALSDVFTEIKTKVNKSKKLNGAEKLNNVAKKLKDKEIINRKRETLNTWNNNAQNIKKNEKINALNAIASLVKKEVKGVKKEFLDVLKNSRNYANKGNNMEKNEIVNISPNNASNISNSNDDGQAKLGKYSGKIIKSAIAIVLDFVLAALAVIFLKEIALIAAIVATALVFVGFGVYLIQNIRCYQYAKSQIEKKSEITDDGNKPEYKQEAAKNNFDLSKYKPPVNDGQSVEENNKSNNYR